MLQALSEPRKGELCTAFHDFLHLPIRYGILVSTKGMCLTPPSTPRDIFESAMDWEGVIRSTYFSCI